MANVQKSVYIGRVYGYLTIKELFVVKRGCTKVIAECRCGTIKEYFLNNLVRKNHTTSCGCHKKEVAGDAVRTHGLSGKHPLHKLWAAMKRRCYNVRADDYPRYGGRGVIVCEEWKNNFLSYFNWCIANGWKQGLNIDKDKIGTGLLYSPETCCIITCKENQNHRKDNIVVEYNGEELTLSQIADKYKVKYIRLWKRYIGLKWDIHRAIITPPRQFK